MNKRNQKAQEIHTVASGKFKQGLPSLWATGSEHISCSHVKQLSKQTDFYSVL